MRQLLYFVLLAQVFFYCNRANCQKENNHWLFGTGLGLDFNVQPPTGPGPTPQENKFWVESFSISPSRFVAQSDINGGLLFYSNGINVWNREHDVMFNGASLVQPGGGLVVEEAIALPGTSCPEYYLFYYGSVGGFQGALFYSVVDMSMDGGLGGIPSGKKNKLLYSDSFESIRVIPGSGHNWLVGMARDDMSTIIIYAFKVGLKGIEDPIISTIELDGIGGTSFELEVSPKGDALIFIQDGFLTDNLPMNLLSFDRLSGVSSYSSTVFPETAPFPDYKSNIITACFSPSGDYLYTVERYGFCQVLECISAYGVFQYRFNKVEQRVVEDSKTQLQFYGVEDHPIGDMKLAPNGKIFLSRFGSPYLDAIALPNSQGTGSLYREEFLRYESGFTSIDLPNQVLTADQYQFIPDIDLCTPYSLCEGQVLVLEVESCYDSILWHDYSNDLVHTIFEAGEYWLDVYYQGCYFRQEFEVIDYVLTNSFLPADTVICNDESFSIDLTQAPVQGIFTWEDGSNNEQRIINQPGLYYVEIDDNGCIYRDSLWVGKYVLPESVIPDDTMKCSQDILFLGAAVFQASYKWSTGELTPSIQIIDEGLYTVTVSIDRCQLVDQIDVISYGEIDLGLIDSVMICKGEPVVINATNSFITDYQWSTGETGPVLNTFEGGEIILTASDQNCTYLDTTFIRHRLCTEAKIYTPNVFSPNRDGINDRYEIYVSDDVEYLSSSMLVYNRWGNQIGKVDDLTQGWNGSLDGRLIQPGVYAALITVRVIDGMGDREIVLAQDILIMR